MALPNDSILVTPGAGATVATHLVGGKEYQVVMPADADGHILGTQDVFWASSTVSSPPATAGTTWMAMFNPAASGRRALVLGIWIATQGTANKTFRLVRTTNGGSGGAAITPFRRVAANAPVVTIQVLPTTQPAGKDAAIGLRLEMALETGEMPVRFSFASYPIELLQGVGLALDADDALAPTLSTVTFVWKEVAA